MKSKDNHFILEQMPFTLKIKKRTMLIMMRINEIYPVSRPLLQTMYPMRKGWRNIS
jgi:hypothetical protein